MGVQSLASGRSLCKVPSDGGKPEGPLVSKGLLM